MIGKATGRSMQFPGQKVLIPGFVLGSIVYLPLSVQGPK